MNILRLPAYCVGTIAVYISELQSKIDQYIRVHAIATIISMICLRFQMADYLVFQGAVIDRNALQISTHNSKESCQRFSRHG